MRPEPQVVRLDREVRALDKQPVLQENLVASPYRSLSVQESPVALDDASVLEFLIGRRVYRRTRYMVLHRDDAYLIAEVAHAGRELLEPVEHAAILSRPADTVFVRDPQIDTAIPSRLAHAARQAGGDAVACVVEGRFQHVNFILNPRPARVTVIDVVPPRPAKLMEMAEQAIAFDEELPPVELELDPVDLSDLADGERVSKLMFPCRCSGIADGRSVEFLDAGPPGPPDWVLVGCTRSLELHLELYGEAPAKHIDFCPRRLLGARSGPTLTRCCLRERGIERHGETVLVPWGATMDEVRSALRILAGLDSAVEAAA